MLTRRILRGLAVAALLWLSGAPALAGAPMASSLDNRHDVELFVDGVIESQMTELHIPAAQVAIVRNGQVLLSKGYGKADLSKGTIVDPDRTLFRIGSLSKLFTETAVMQLVEQGKLDLDRDVNHYLKGIQVPKAFGRPVTMRQLITHTAGFEEGFFGYGRAHDAAAAVFSIRFLKDHMPARVHPPGEMWAYSNYGIALAGLVVQQISGEPYELYIQRHILNPLGMANTTFHAPLSPAFKVRMQTGYLYEEGKYVAQPFELSALTPAGVGSAPASDMARFMIAHLQQGRFGQTQILRPETATLMHDGGFQADPAFERSGLGFFAQRINGRRVLLHTGDTGEFHTYLYLVPQDGVGIYVNYVGDGGAAARDTFMRVFFDRYLQDSAAAEAPLANARRLSERVAGVYALNRRNHSAVEKLLTTWGAAATLASTEDGRLHMSFPAIQREWIFAPVGPGLFHEVGGGFHLAVKQDRAGQIQYVTGDFLPFLALEPMPWWEQPGTWRVLLGGAAILFAFTIIGAAYRFSHIRSLPAPQRRAVYFSVATAAWACVTVLAVVLALLNNPHDRIAVSTRVALLAPLVFVLLTAITAAHLPMVLRGRDIRLLGRVHYVLVVLCALLLCLFLAQWNLLGWQFG